MAERIQTLLRRINLTKDTHMLKYILKINLFLLQRNLSDHHYKTPPTGVKSFLTKLQK